MGFVLMTVALFFVSGKIKGAVRKRSNADKPFFKLFVSEEVYIAAYLICAFLWFI